MIDVCSVETVVNVSWRFNIQVFSVVVKVVSAGAHNDYETTRVLDPRVDPQETEEHEQTEIEHLFVPNDVPALWNIGVRPELIQ